MTSCGPHWPCQYCEEYGFNGEKLLLNSCSENTQTGLSNRRHEIIKKHMRSFETEKNIKKCSAYLVFLIHSFLACFVFQAMASRIILFLKKISICLEERSLAVIFGLELPVVNLIGLICKTNKGFLPPKFYFWGKVNLKPSSGFLEIQIMHT